MKFTNFSDILSFKLKSNILVFIIIVMISSNLKAQNKFGLYVTEGLLQFDRFSNYGYVGSETWYLSQALQSEIELYYNFVYKSNLKMHIGLGFANTYFLDTGFLFPIDEQSNSIFTKLNTKYFLGETSFFLLGSFKLYYVPPLFRKYHSQKFFFESFEFGFGYKIKNYFLLNIGLTASLSSPYYNDRLTRLLGTNIDPNLEFSGIFIGIAKTIY
jgi:hypothetical protein